MKIWEEKNKEQNTRQIFKKMNQLVPSIFICSYPGITAASADVCYGNPEGLWLSDLIISPTWSLFLGLFSGFCVGMRLPAASNHMKPLLTRQS